MRVITELYHITGISEIDSIPEFFHQEVPLYGKSEHDEVEYHSRDGELLDVD